MPLLGLRRPAQRIEGSCRGFSNANYITEVCLFQTTFDNASRGLAITCNQFTADDGCADKFGGVYDFLDTRHSQSDVHGCDTSEVKSLQSHLCPWLTDRLRADGADG